MSLELFSLIYGAGFLLTAILFPYVNIKYYGKGADGVRWRKQATKHLWGLSIGLGVFWPIGLPSFLYHYRKIVVSVMKGRDWADDMEDNELVKALLRMDEGNAIIKMLEEEYVRQMAGESNNSLQHTKKTDERLN